MINLPFQGNKRSLCKLGARLHMDTPGVVFHTSRGPRQHNKTISNLPATTTWNRNSPKRSAPLDNSSTTRFSPLHQTRTHSNRARLSKAREDRWQQSHASQSLKDKYRAFQKGYTTFSRRIIPTHHALSHATSTTNAGFNDDTHYYEPGTDNVPQHKINLALSQESHEMRRMMELLEDGGVGFMPDKKDSGWVRVMFENWNSLGVFTQSWKIDRLNYLIKRLQVDIVAGCESQCNWAMMDKDHHFLNLLVVPAIHMREFNGIKKEVLPSRA